jgi:hypothetical protein
MPIPLVRIEAQLQTYSKPFVFNNRALFQQYTTYSLSSSAQAKYTFTLPSPGMYYITGIVNAPNSNHNSFYINIDSQPTNPYMIWDIIKTNNWERRFVSWRENKLPEQNTRDRKFFTLTAGEHTVILRGRESNTQIRNIVIHRVSN